MNVLCVVAHPDDEIIGCGATIRKLRNAGHEVYTHVLCGNAGARHGRPDNLRTLAAEAEQLIGVSESIKSDFPNIEFNTVSHLEMVKAIEQSIERFRPRWVFTHHKSDLNVDHRVCHETTMSAVMLPQRLSVADMAPTMIERVYLFEILSSTDWASPLEPAFQPNSFFDVRDTFAAKLAALDAFEGALKPFPHSRSRENLKHLAHLRGGQIGIELAEAFVLVRDVNL
jgi:LmbE family N-acetylglucosaminyl deacetylase